MAKLSAINLLPEKAFVKVRRIRSDRSRCAASILRAKPLKHLVPPYFGFQVKGTYQFADEYLERLGE